MSTEIIEVSQKRELKEFIHAPTKLHRGHEGWATPLYSDEWKFFSRRKNKNFNHSDTVMVLAKKRGRIVGRCMGIINKRFLEISGEKTARFGYLESTDDIEVTKALVTHVEKWAKSRNMNKIVGPMGFTDQDPEGFLIEGFGNEPTLATYYNYEFIPEHIEKLGYGKEVDYVVYKIPVTSEYPPIYKKVLERLSRKNEFKLVEFGSASQIKPYIVPVLSLVNDVFSHLYGYVPLAMEEMEDLAKQYLPALNPKFLKVVEKDSKLVGFILGIPNMDEGFRKARGRLLPLGFYHILSASKRSRQLDLLLGGIDREYRDRGIDVLLGSSLMKSAHDSGIKFMDSHLELESNTLVQAEMKRFGGQVYKKYRIFQKKI